MEVIRSISEAMSLFWWLLDLTLMLQRWSKSMSVHWGVSTRRAPPLDGFIHRRWALKKGGSEWVYSGKMWLGPWHRGPSTGTAMMKVSSLVIAAVAKGSMLTKSFGAMPGHHRCQRSQTNQPADSRIFCCWGGKELAWLQIGCGLAERSRPRPRNKQKQETSSFF